uniref:type IV pilus assembly protein FimV n=1 Tax=Undibacterium sp. TaxID=1914977 RepID=UPI003750C4F5
MHNYKRLPISFLGSKVLKAAALSSLLVFSNAYATGLGKLTVLSSLGQPLRAEIELTSPNKEEISSLVPKVASIEAFRQANIEFNPALLSLRFAVEQRGNSYIIRVTSTQAMNEPWVDFLLEMNASNGKLVREYTFLLDPAELATGQSAQIANPTASIR